MAAQGLPRLLLGLLRPQESGQCITALGFTFDGKIAQQRQCFLAPDVMLFFIQGKTWGTEKVQLERGHSWSS